MSRFFAVYIFACLSGLPNAMAQLESFVVPSVVGAGGSTTDESNVVNAGYLQEKKPAGDTPSPASDPILKCLMEMKHELANLSTRITELEKSKCNIAVAAAESVDSFATRKGLPKCEDLPDSTHASQTKGMNTKDSKSDCNSDEACAWVPAKRVFTTYITSHKKVIVSQPTPYIDFEKPGTLKRVAGARPMSQSIETNHTKFWFRTKKKSFRVCWLAKDNRYAQRLSRTPQHAFTGTVSVES